MIALELDVKTLLSIKVSCKLGYKLVLMSTIPNPALSVIHQNIVASGAPFWARKIHSEVLKSSNQVCIGAPVDWKEYSFASLALKNISFLVNLKILNSYKF
jgi:hypothetical protein